MAQALQKWWGKKKRRSQNQKARTPLKSTPEAQPVEATAAAVL
jgi:hypothetical protein